MLSAVDILIKDFTKGGKKEEVAALKLVKAELLNNQKTVKPKEELAVVKSYYKRLTKSMDAYQTYPDRQQAIQKEIDIIKTLLPEMPSEQKVRDHVEVTIQNWKSQLNAGLQPGVIIGSVKKQLPNADGGLVARLVKECLAQ